MNQKQLFPITKYNQELSSPVIRKKFQSQVKAIGLPMVYDTEKSFALQAIAENTGLQQCDPASVVKCLNNVSITGLSLNPKLGHSFLIPRRVKGVMTCCLDIGYQGWIFIAHENGYVKSVKSYIVYRQERERGDFKIELGTEPKLHHIPYYAYDEPEPTYEDAIGAYTRLKLVNEEIITEYMSKAKILAVRDRSQSYQTALKYKRQSIWDSQDWARMWQKTTIINALKFVPSKNMNERTMVAMELEHSDVDLETEKSTAHKKAKTDGTLQDIEAKIHEQETVDVDHEEVFAIDEDELKEVMKIRKDELKYQAENIANIEAVPGKDEKRKFAEIVLAHKKGKLKEYYELIFKGKGNWMEVCKPKPLNIKTPTPIDERLVTFVELHGEKKERTMQEYMPVMKLLEGLGIDENFRANMKDKYPWTSIDHLCKSGTLHEITDILQLYAV